MIRVIEADVVVSMLIALVAFAAWLLWPRRTRSLDRL